MPTERTKEELLEHYAEREPRRFIQFDSFNPPTWPVGPGSEDEDGDEMWGRFETYELMHGATVRVLIDPETDPEIAIRMLRKIADWIERDAAFEPELLRNEIPF